MKTIRTRMQGASLITAIFLLVVLAGLGVAMVTLSTSQQKSSTMDVLGTRAYLAARAGAEWGVYGVLQGGGACATSTFSMPAGAGTLSPFNVTVACATVTQFGIVRRQVTATACNQAGGCGNASNNPDYVQRVVTVEF
ncbi:MAG: agglutinin biogenesis protein MshP [Pseudomonadota bacterium]